MKPSLSTLATILTFFIGASFLQAQVGIIDSGSTLTLGIYRNGLFGNPNPPSPPFPPPGLGGFILLEPYAPASIAGDSFLIQNDNTNASPNLALFVADNTGSNYTMLPIVNNSFSMGFVSYSNTNFATGVLGLVDLTDGKLEQVNLTFGNYSEGTFVYTNLTDTNSGTGEFQLAAASAPISLAGQTLSCTVLSGAFPFATNGTFNVYYSGSGTSYMVIGAGGVQDSAGNSTFQSLNYSTMSVGTSDNVTGISSNYLAFTNSSAGVLSLTNYPSGILAITQTNTGGYQIDAFTVTTSLPPFYSNSVSLSNNWYWMSNSSNNLYGYYSTAYLPYIYHADMGWQYYMDAGDGYAGGYFYDFSDSAWYYSNPGTFPYLYDFSANAWMWYEPSTNAPDHMSSNPRWFYNTSESNWVNSLSMTNIPL